MDYWRPKCFETNSTRRFAWEGKSSWKPPWSGGGHTLTSLSLIRPETNTLSVSSPRKLPLVLVLSLKNAVYYTIKF